jgi:hypothetical protein
MLWVAALAAAVSLSMLFIELEARSKNGREFIERINNPWLKK